MVTMNQAKSTTSTIPAQQPPTLAKRQEVRCAVRFPLALPIVLTTSDGDVGAVTYNVSASGVLFELDTEIAPGTEIQFALRMPGTILGTPRDVLVNCRGRVVRCSVNQTLHQAAATIDDYKFVEQ